MKVGGGGLLVLDSSLNLVIRGFKQSAVRGPEVLNMRGP